MDILIQEQGSGGEIIVRDNDLVVINGLENQPYLASFGGDDWFGNSLFLQGDQQLTGQTEKVLMTTTLNSEGRQLVENTLKQDLEYLKDIESGTTIAVAATIADKNRIDAAITISGTEFALQYNPDTTYLNYTLK